MKNEEHLFYMVEKHRKKNSRIEKNILFTSLSLTRYYLQKEIKEKIGRD